MGHPAGRGLQLVGPLGWPHSTSPERLPPLRATARGSGAALTPTWTTPSPNICTFTPCYKFLKCTLCHTSESSGSLCYQLPADYSHRSKELIYKKYGKVKYLSHLNLCNFMLDMTDG